MCVYYNSLSGLEAAAVQWQWLLLLNSSDVPSCRWCVDSINHQSNISILQVHTDRRTNKHMFLLAPFLSPVLLCLIFDVSIAFGSFVLSLCESCLFVCQCGTGAHKPSMRSLSPSLSLSWLLFSLCHNRNFRPRNRRLRWQMISLWSLTDWLTYRLTNCLLPWSCEAHHAKQHHVFCTAHHHHNHLMVSFTSINQSLSLFHSFVCCFLHSGHWLLKLISIDCYHR